MEFKSQNGTKQRLNRKRTPHPFALTSVGCVWKNPAGEVADQLIERVGLTSKRLSGAEVSTKRANVIVDRDQRGGSRQDLRRP